MSVLPELEYLKKIEQNTKRIADALEGLLKESMIKRAAERTLEVLKGEGDGLKVVQEVNAPKKLEVDTKVYDDLKQTEEVIMDLTEVTIMVITGKAILAVKKGFQKWVPKSTIKEFDNLDISEGDFLKDIPLTAAAEKWLPEKLWEKYEVKKR